VGDLATFGPLYEGGPDARSCNCPACDATFIVEGFPSRTNPRSASWIVKFCPFCGEPDPGSVQALRKHDPKGRAL